MNQKFRKGVKEGLRKGWSGYIWLLKILVPISFFTALLNYSGWLGHLNFILEPAMSLIHLPPVAALPILAGMLTGIYGAVAALTVLELTKAQITLVAIFVLISHALIQEGAVQGKSGLNVIKATLIRLCASIATVWVVGFFFINTSGDPATSAAGFMVEKQAFFIMVKSWFVATFWLSAKILAIIMTLMIILENLKTFNLIPYIVKGLSPILKLLGLDREVGLMWVAAVFFGISYGSAVIVEEAKGGHFTTMALEKLHISIGVNHAVIEDPALFLPFGISLFWLWIPRLITAIVAVQLYRIWIRARGKEQVLKQVRVNFT
ncbi:MAG: nucleoside recognition domain-containing protein [Desulfobacterales bacterium]